MSSQDKKANTVECRDITTSGSWQYPTKSPERVNQQRTNHPKQKAQGGPEAWSDAACTCAFQSCGEQYGIASQGS